MTLPSFVFAQITSLVKPVHIFMATSRVSKYCLKAELCFHRFAHFSVFRYMVLVFTTSSVLAISRLVGFHFCKAHHSDVVFSTLGRPLRPNKKKKAFQDDMHLSFRRVGSPVTLHNFVIADITFAVKLVHIFIARSRVSV